MKKSQGKEERRKKRKGKLNLGELLDTEASNGRTFGDVINRVNDDRDHRSARDSRANLESRTKGLCIFFHQMCQVGDGIRPAADTVKKEAAIIFVSDGISAANVVVDVAVVSEGEAHEIKVVKVKFGVVRVQADCALVTVNLFFGGMDSDDHALAAVHVVLFDVLDHLPELLGDKIRADGGGSALFLFAVLSDGETNDMVLVAIDF